MSRENALKVPGDVLLIHRMGKKSDYFALVCDLGYCRKFLTFETYAIAEMLSILPRDLITLCPLDSEVAISFVGVPSAG